MKSQLGVLGVLAIWILSLGFPRPCEAAPWFEFWSRGGYFQTNTERADSNIYLGRSEGKLGFPLIPLSPDVALSPYVAYYGVASSDVNHWNNNLAVGLGVRIKPLPRYGGSGWYDEWIRDMRLFYESLSINYHRDDGPDKATFNKTKDTRYGIDGWHEWNQPQNWKGAYSIKESVPWGEMWLSLAYRETHFLATPFASYVLQWNPLVGLYLKQPGDSFGVEPYLKMDLVLSEKPDYFLNNLAAGVGIRIQPFRYVTLPGEGAPWYYKFKVFVELLGIRYLKDKPPTAAKTVPGDLRIGVDFTYGR